MLKFSQWFMIFWSMFTFWWLGNICFHMFVLRCARVNLSNFTCHVFFRFFLSFAWTRWFEVFVYSRSRGKWRFEVELFSVSRAGSRSRVFIIDFLDVFGYRFKFFLFLFKFSFDLADILVFIMDGPLELFHCE